VLHPPYQAIVFDFGGVFTHSVDLYDELLQFDRQLGQPEGTLHARLYSGDLWEAVSTGQISVDEYWQGSGAPFVAALPPKFALYRRGIFHLEPINEAMVVIGQQIHRRYRTALCSNALHDLPELLAERPDIADIFDVRVISVLVGLRKPDSRIFALTAERLGLSIGECLLIDDKERNTLAAEQAGMQTLLFRSPLQLRETLHSIGVF
jgi:HAD superfamily hydrolase (TIGR01509 family)